MRAEHEATLLSVGAESRVFAVSSSTSGLLLSPPPSHSETCMPTVCTRNFLGKPSSNLHAFLFPALRGKGFSTPAWHALSEDPVGDGCCWDRAWEKDAAEKANGVGDRTGSQYDGEGGSRPPASSQSGVQTAIQQEWYQTRQWEDITIMNKTSYLTSRHSAACMVFCNVRLTLTYHVILPYCSHQGCD